MELKQDFPSRRAGGTLAAAMGHKIPHAAARGAQLQAGAALPRALCSSCSLGKPCQAAHTSQLVERKVSAQHHASQSSKGLFLSRSSCSSPCRTPPLNQAHKQAVFKEEVQLYSARKMQRAPGEEIQHIFPKGERWYTGEENRWVFRGLPLTFIWNTLITYLIHIHSWPIASCSDILQELTNSLTLLWRLSHNPSWVALISEYHF